jgi:CRP-like cAMP-binding protein
VSSPLALRMFRGVPDAAVDALYDAGERLDLRPGAFVVSQGDDATASYVVLSGRLKARLEPGAQDLGDLFPGEVIGPEAVFGRKGTYLTSVVAVNPSTVLKLTRVDLMGLPDSPAVAAMQRHLITVTARRLRTVDHDVRKLWMAQERAAAAERAAERHIPEPEPLGLFGRLKALLGGGQ